MTTQTTIQDAIHSSWQRACPNSTPLVIFVSPTLTKLTGWSFYEDVPLIIDYRLPGVSCYCLAHSD